MNEERALSLSRLLKDLSEDVLHNRVKIGFADFTHDFHTNEYRLSVGYGPLDGAEVTKKKRVIWL